MTFRFQISKMGKFTGKKCRLLSMLWLTSILFIVEIVVGYITNSMSLVADSFHMLSDVAALVVAFLSVKVCIFRLLYFFKISIMYFNPFFIAFRRCHRKNGPKTLSDGPELKF